MPLIDIREVSKVYEPLPAYMRLLLRTQVSEPVMALDHVSLALEPGEVCVVVGPNGAGKSTLFRILTGLTTPTSGDALISGLNVTRESTRVRQRIGFAPAEERTLLMRHSCRENLQFHGAMQGMRGSRLMSSINENLDFVGLGSVADRAAVALSSGMRARLQLARALLTRPEVLLLDEPTSAIDPVAAREIIRLVLVAARERGAAVLISSHRLEEIEELQERVLLLDRGKALYVGDLGAFRRQFSAPTLEITFADASAAKHARQSLTRSGHSVHDGLTPASFALDGTPSIAAAAALVGDNPGVVGISERAPSLLDVLERVWAGHR